MRSRWRADARSTSRGRSPSIARATRSVKAIFARRPRKHRRTYVVGYKPEDYRIIRDVRARMFADADPPASTLVGVAALAIDGLLIEMEAIAAVE
jgi:enamine deaminase RidA (YjgF/YER057c/UK114 family)